MNVLSLFAGIGGFDLGLERAGMRVVAQCEINPYCRAVLKKHWPDVPCYQDVRTLTADTLQRDGITVDVICGGFPCQDLSHAGLRAGLEGERSGLWSEYARIIGEIRPKYVIVENVTGLLSLGMGRVLGDLSERGYYAEWRNIPALMVGAPHRRERIWIVAHAKELHRDECDDYPCKCVGTWPLSKLRNDGRKITLAHPASIGLQESGRLGEWRGTTSAEKGPSDYVINGGWWATEPPVGRVANGIPSRVDRLSGLGNAVLPQIPEIIGKAIQQATTPTLSQ